MISTKVCFKCGVEKSIEEFYKHPQMLDGHLNKCKDCARKDVSRNTAKRSQDLAWRIKERARGREKYFRLGYKERKMRHPETRSVMRYFKSRGIQLQGCEYHHWNYNLLHDVIVLPINIHRKLHNLIQYDEDSKCFYHNGILLGSKQDHINLIKSIIS